MKRASGQTLIEVLVALGIVVVGLSAAAALVFSNLQLVEQDTDRVIATNLAREGIELTKQIRDSNWLAGAAFDTGLVNQTTPSDLTATPVWDGVIARPAMDFTANALGDTNAQVVLSTAASAKGFYANRSSVPSISGTATSFRRLMTFSPICADLATNIQFFGSTPCSGGQTKIGIRVRSEVQWNRRGRIVTDTMYEDLYDWK